MKKTQLVYNQVKINKSLPTLKNQVWFLVYSKRHKTDQEILKNRIQGPAENILIYVTKNWNQEDIKNPFKDNNYIYIIGEKNKP